VTDHLQLIRQKLDHLARMRQYLDYSLGQTAALLPIKDWSSLSAENHETLAAFRVRFGEFQEHLGKTMRAVAIEEEQKTEPFGAVLAYMEKLGVLHDPLWWKSIRELRNAVNHEVEDDPTRLGAFFLQMTQAVPALFVCHDKLRAFCHASYGIESHHP
jgi:hypothetical protein